jgi:TPR repeat protein
MRTSERIALFFAVALAVGVVPAAGLDGTLAPPNTPAPTPFEAFRSGAMALKAGETAKALNALEYAAEAGHAAAQWKLGRMYADGDQVPQNDLRAFQYFSRIANSHAEDSPEAPQSRYVANAFVVLGQYYRDGIPNTAIRPDPVRARQMFSYAASYFGDADAQYQLARSYLDGRGLAKEPRQAARWLGLAANKGQHQAQAVLGYMLFKGDSIPRQGARGLMWLTLAKDSAGRSEEWIGELYDSAFKTATADERSLALVYLESWLKGRRE